MATEARNGSRNNQDNVVVVVDDENDENDNNNEEYLELQPEEQQNRDASSSVRVAVRVRPFLAFEHGSDNCMEVIKEEGLRSSPRRQKGYDDDNDDSFLVPTAIRVGGQKSGPRFTFDQVFDGNAKQSDIFSKAVAPLVDCCLEGYNATILAYGQTGSGKTHTMMGPSPTTAVAITTTNGSRRNNKKDMKKWRNGGSSRKRERSNRRRGVCGNADEENNEEDDTVRSDDEDDNDDMDCGNDDCDCDDDKNDEDVQELVDYDVNVEDDDHDSAGIIPRALQSIFSQLEEKKKKSMSTTTSSSNCNNNATGGILLDYQVSIQLLELYGEEIRDLLTTVTHNHRGDKKLTIRDLGTDEPEVVGATQQTVVSAEEALLCLSHGMLRRVTGATAMNESSSRSHAILSVLVEQQQTFPDNCSINNTNTNRSDDNSSHPLGLQDLPTPTNGHTDESDIDNNENSTAKTTANHVLVTHSRFNFVDLAGSERQKRTHASGKRLKEGIDINKGLFVLGNVISALGDPKKRGKTFVPYRDSKLTRLLKGSLGGNHKTLMIACVSPSSNNLEESLNCLRYANRAKNIQNNAVVNVDGPSRLIQELQTHVQVLASDLLKILRDNSWTTENSNKNTVQQQSTSTVKPSSTIVIKTTYPEHILETMATGGTMLGSSVLPLPTSPVRGQLVSSPVIVTKQKSANYSLTFPPLPLPGNASSDSQCHPPSLSNYSTFSSTGDTASASVAGGTRGIKHSPTEDDSLMTRLQDMEIELLRTNELLRQSRSNHDAAEEQLYIAKAQKELIDLQLAVLSSNCMNSKGSNAIVPRVNSEFDPGEAFLKKAISYETEIGHLKSSLVAAESKMERMKWALNVTTLEVGGVNRTNNDEQDLYAIEQASLQLQKDREQLLILQRQYSSSDDGFDNSNTQFSTNNNNNDDEYGRMLDKIDEEQIKDETEIKNLTKKYIQSEASSSDDDDDDENCVSIESGKHNNLQRTPDRSLSMEHVTTSSGASLAGRTLQASSPSPELPPASQRERQVQADLAELSRSIAAKESLIVQLRQSQEKYASMREFYEDRLRRMEVMLNEKEQEREHLLLQLKESKESGHAGSKEIEEKIGQKEKHIADLRKRQQELRKLTAVSSRNDLEIGRLHDEVQSMKRLKVELQKKISEERKTHAKQMKELQRNALVKDKELANAKRISTKKEIEAARANQVAKQRLDELSQLRMKYKDSEKRLRMASLKRGVLAKAGIDPVIVGRRENTGSLSMKGSNTASTHQEDVACASRTGMPKSGGNIDVNLLRSYFDQKVASVVRKEAIVDKLAREWEEHFELSNRKQDLLEQKRILGESEEIEEAQQGLLVQLQFKEERIRTLASLIRKPDYSPNTKSNTPNIPTSDVFLFDKEFASICKGSKPDRSHVVAARVLFGMIVRERRRVAALARTASSLDERVQAAEQAAELSEAALRSYMEEQRQELAAMTQDQQEQILSLMDMVKEDLHLQQPRISSSDDVGWANKGDYEEVFQRKLLVLANERVSLLERQISELQSDANESNSYLRKLEEMKDSLTGKLQDYEDVQLDLLELRKALRQIREALRTGSANEFDNEIPSSNLQALVLDIVRGALDPNTLDDRPKHIKMATPPRTSGNHARTSLNGGRLSGLRVRSSHQHLDDLLGDSDSDESITAQEAPDWANDIMADLALIAEGKLPPSMANAPSFIEEVSHFEKIQQRHKRNTKVPLDSYKALPISTEIPYQQQNGASEVITESKPGPDQTVGNEFVQSTNKSLSDSRTASVFDRLSDPKQFTGTRKQVRTKPKATAILNSRPTSGKLSPHRRREDRRAMSKEISNRLDKVTVPSSTILSTTTLGDNENDGDTSSKGYQSVFERLMSPSQYTGTQKEKFHETRQIRERTADQVADRVLDGLLHSKETTMSKVASGGGEVSVAQPVSESLHPNTSHSFRNVAYTEYAQQDVFERLQKTTTMAFAVKTHHHSSADSYPLHHLEDANNRWYRNQDGTEISASLTPIEVDDPCNKPNTTVAASFSSSIGTISGVSRHDTTTISPTTSEASAALAEKHVHSAYMRQDVFERLQKTTTEAYAKKTNSR